MLRVVVVVRITLIATPVDLIQIVTNIYANN